MIGYMKKAGKALMPCLLSFLKTIQSSCHPLDTSPTSMLLSY